MNRWIDVHTHLNMLDVEPEIAVQQATAAGVEKMITIGTEPSDLKLVHDLARRFYPKVYCFVGIHPHEAKHYTDEIENEIRGYLSSPWVLGVGEIGLDYHYDHSPREIQKRVFRRQLQLAVDAGLPIEIHTREAEADTIAILDEFKGRVRGLFHCFTSSAWLANEGLARGFNISFSGVITFKNAEDLRNIVRTVPLNRLHVETDAPFLAPVPMRGKKNLPEFVVHTAKAISELKGITEEQLAQQTWANAVDLFKKLKS